MELEKNNKMGEVQPCVTPPCSAHMLCGGFVVLNPSGDSSYQDVQFYTSCSYTSLLQTMESQKPNSTSHTLKADRLPTQSFKLGLPFCFGLCKNVLYKLHGILTAGVISWLVCFSCDFCVSSDLPKPFQRLALALLLSGTHTGQFKQKTILAEQIMQHEVRSIKYCHSS